MVSVSYGIVCIPEIPIVVYGGEFSFCSLEIITEPGATTV